MHDSSHTPIEISLMKSPNETIPPEERGGLVDRLHPITVEGFGTDMKRGDVENHVIGCDLLYLVSANGELVGFSSYSVMSNPLGNILYLNGIVVRRNFQGSGLFGKINNMALNSAAFDFFAMRTQNPLVYAGTRKLVKEI